MSGQGITVAFLIVGMMAAVGWGQEAAPESVAQESATTAPDTADKGALSADAEEKAQPSSDEGKPTRTWEEIIEDWMTPKPFEKRYVVKIDDRYAYPHVVSGIKMEIVREDDDYIWLRGISPEDPN